MLLILLRINCAEFVMKKLQASTLEPSHAKDANLSLEDSVTIRQLSLTARTTIFVLSTRGTGHLAKPVD